MLGYVHGRLISKNFDNLHFVVQAGPLGYEITVPKRLVEKTSLETELSLWLHTHVREDVFTFYGFETENEKTFFRLLLSVSGLGPKTALALLSEFAPETLTDLILGKRIGEISKAPGVGKKIAERLCVELSGKLEKLALKDISAPRLGLTQPLNSPALQIREDLASALANLGYQPAPIKIAMEKLFALPDFAAQPFETSLKMALQELSNRGVGHA